VYIQSKFAFDFWARGPQSSGKPISRFLLLGSLAALIGLSACSGSSSGEVTARAQSALTPTTGLDAPLLFDWQYYVGLYPDLQAAFGNNPAALTQHWLTNGIYEGRRASPVFDCSLYLGIYPDLSKAFGSDCAAAMNHFFNTGLPLEGRRASIEFDAHYYLSFYSDISTAYGNHGYLSAATHFVTTGLWNEGRAGSNEFDVRYYLCYYSDLSKVFGLNFRSALNHYNTTGLPLEGRRSSATLDIKWYLSQFTTLQNALGTANYLGAMYHWVIKAIPGMTYRTYRPLPSSC